ncbi:MAG: hypothetical protein AABX04_02480 [Nanoarchaeota archaeon]
MTLLLTGLVAAELTISPVTLKFDYADLGEDDKRLDFSETITLTNSGTLAESGTLSLTILDNDFRELIISSTSFNLAAGATQTLTLSGEAPVNLDYNYNDNFAKLTITTASASKEVNFKATIAPMIEMDRVYVYVNGNQEDDYQKGDTIDGILPGDEVELRFILSNRYDNDYEKGDISGSILVELNDFEVDKEVSFDLAAGDEFGQSDAPFINFTIPFDADEDEYDIDLAFDNLKSVSGAEFDLDSWTLTLSIEKNRDDLRINNLNLDQTEISCFRKIEITGQLSNVGNDNQPDSSVTLNSQELGINKVFDFSLNEGKSQPFTQLFEVSSVVKAGSYPITARAYIDGDDLRDQQILELTVKDCSSATKAANTTTPVKNITAASTTTTTTSTATASTATSAANNKPAVTGAATAVPLSSSEIVKTVEKSYTKSDYLAALMLVALVFAIVMIIVFALILLR